MTKYHEKTVESVRAGFYGIYIHSQESRNGNKEYFICTDNGADQFFGTWRPTKSNIRAFRNEIMKPIRIK